ncbi:MAG: hypothetical protein JW797_06625 [Bradymonadales bacterium]|nr:hypothetical protein [Bradymonadales bacterium]
MKSPPPAIPLSPEPRVVSKKQRQSQTTPVLSARLAPIALLLAMVLAGVTLSSGAQAFTPIPPYPADAVAVADVEDNFDPLRQQIAQFQSSVGATYQVLVVAFSDRLDRVGPDYGDDTNEYINAVVEAWSPSVDPAKGVIIVLSIQNRDIIVHPGSRWAELGFEGPAVVQVIDGSAFGPNARAGNYNEAIIQLIRAVDRELERRIRARQNEVAREVAAIPNHLAALDGIEQRLAQTEFDTTSFYEQLEEIRTTLGLAQSNLQERDTETAGSLQLRTARTALSGLDRAVSEMETRARQVVEGVELLGTLRNRRAALPAWLAEHGQDAARYQTELAEVDAMLERAGALVGDINETYAAQNELSNVRSTLDMIELKASMWLKQHRFWTRTVPLVAGIIAAILLLIGFLVFRGDRRRKRRRATERLEEWDAMLSTASERLVNLENEHTLLLGRADMAEHFRGATREPITELARKVDALFLSFEAASGLSQKAGQLIEATGPLTRKGFVEADRLLTDREVVARTEDVKERQLFLPDVREVRMPARELLRSMDTTYTEVIEQLKQLEAEVAKSWGEMEQTSAELVEATGALEELLSAGGFELVVYEEAAENLAQRQTVLQEKSGVDPLGSAEEVGRLRAEVKGLRDRLARLRQLSSMLEERVSPRIGELEQRLSNTRKTEGLRLAEPGFEPDAMLDRAQELELSAVSAVAEGEEVRALEKAREAATLLDELSGLVDDTLRSRAQSSQTIAELKERGKTLRAALPERRQRIAQLQEVHYDSALQPALDNAQQAEEVLGFVDQILVDALQACGDGEQRYLAAAELIRRATTHLDEVDALYQEIETKAEFLAECRRQAEAAVARVKVVLSRIRAELASDVPFAQASTKELEGKASGKLERLQQVMVATRIDWRAASKRAERLEKMVSDLSDIVKAERKAYTHATELQTELERKRKAVQALLDSSEVDRPAANERFQTAVETMKNAQKLSKREEVDWVQVLGILHTADTMLDESEKLAEEDARLDRSARQGIAEAESAIRDSDRAYGHGISADLGTSRQILAAAAGLLLQRKYEEALSQATKARTNAITQKQKAESRVAQRQLEQISSAPRSSSWGSSSRSSSSSSSSSSWGSSRSSSSSSWGSSSSSSSSSGRSSYGSSSGRSSFSSSSGRSKW